MENKLVNNMKNKLKVPKGKVSEWVNGVLTLVDKKSKNVIDRIKTFEDAVTELGEEHKFVNSYRAWQEIGIETQSPGEAFLKLRIICAALNEGWEPQFTKSEWKYCPLFYLYTRDEIDKMDEGKKQIIHLISTGNYRTEYAGFASAESYTTHSNKVPITGSWLYLKNSDLAFYCGWQFTHLWADFNLIRK